MSPQIRDLALHVQVASRLERPECWAAYLSQQVERTLDSRGCSRDPGNGWAPESHHRQLQADSPPVPRCAEHTGSLRTPRVQNPLPSSGGASGAGRRWPWTRQSASLSVVNEPRPELQQSWSPGLLKADEDTQVPSVLSRSLQIGEIIPESARGPGGAGQKRAAAVPYI
jgi:hypothetical protein